MRGSNILPQNKSAVKNTLRSYGRVKIRIYFQYRTIFREFPSLHIGILVVAEMLTTEDKRPAKTDIYI